MSKRKQTKRPRGAVTKGSAKLLGAYLPTALIALVDQVVRAQDTDRSKFFRAAVREKLERENAA